LHLRYIFGLLLLLLLLAAAVVGLVLWVLPPLTDQMGQLLAEIPGAQARLHAILQHTPWLQTLLGSGDGTNQTSGVSVGELAGSAGAAASSPARTLGEALGVLAAPAYRAAHPDIYIEAPGPPLRP